MTDYARARANMVENQLRPSRIDNPRLLAAMGEIPREAFCPAQLEGAAYGDDDIDLGGGRHLIEPLALAKLAQAADPRPGDVALVIGCDTGYCAAVLSRMVATLFLLVPDAPQARAVEELLAGLGCDNVVLQTGDPHAGLAAQAPFDVVLLAGSVERVPDHLIDQLGEGGRLVAVVNHGRVGKVTLYRKLGDVVGNTTPVDASVPPLAGLRPEPAFSF
ncbi:MAG TPA: protein-L-isoaspartate O-methyltransferase [Geminicoccaceae bacterium]|nr:protein-L-isoaspartate O-methyltransferase [Geminicoccus sp.]HMU49284.1 protein-L-isoaspartate O-methyltransferase [Geminicoccaceae bacterium]